MQTVTTFGLDIAKSVFQVHCVADGQVVIRRQLKRRYVLAFFQKIPEPAGIDHRRLLPDEQMACAVECQAALLLGRLGRDEPHVRPGDRLADGLSISSLQGLQVDDADELEPPASGGGEGGMDKRRGQSTFRRHLTHACRVQGPLSL